MAGSAATTRAPTCSAARSAHQWWGKHGGRRGLAAGPVAGGIDRRVRAMEYYRIRFENPRWSRRRSSAAVPAETKARPLVRKLLTGEEGEHPGLRGGAGQPRGAERLHQGSHGGAHAPLLFRAKQGTTASSGNFCADPDDYRDRRVSTATFMAEAEKRLASRSRGSGSSALRDHPVPRLEWSHSVVEQVARGWSSSTRSRSTPASG